MPSPLRHWLLALLLSTACADEAQSNRSANDTATGPTSGELSTLTYNVHGLPSQVTGDDTPGRMAQIAPLLDDFDLVGLQEDFDDDNHATLVSQAPQPVQERFAEALPDRVYGPGLAMLAPEQLLDLHHEHYDACNGTLDGASDCLASKGFQALTLRLGPGAEIDVYNTHMEAGGGDEDDAARQDQLDQLLAHLDGQSADRAVIFLGDTNLHDSDPDDLPLVVQLKEEGGLADACDLVGCPEPGRIDRVMLRSSAAVQLEALDWQVAPGFVDADGAPLSDHDPIVVTVGWSRPD